MTGAWVLVEEWEEYQPMRCTVCGVVLSRRDLTWLPNFCDDVPGREACPGARDAPKVRVKPIVNATTTEDSMP